MQRNAAAHRGGGDFAGLGVEAQRRHRDIAVQRKERTRLECLARTRNEVTHFGDILDAGGPGGGGEHVFLRAGETGVSRVDIQRSCIRHVARDQRTAEEMDIVEAVDQARGIVQIAQYRFTVGSAIEVYNQRRGATGTDVHARTPQMHIESRIPPAQREIAGEALQRIFDKLGRKT